MSMTPDQIIDLLGGPKAVSLACNEPLGTVWNWRDRRSIPAKHHLKLLELARRKRVRLTARQFVEAHAEDRP